MANFPGTTSGTTASSISGPSSSTFISGMSTPTASGSAIISENIDTPGVEVPDVRPFIAQDIRDFQECEVDTMLRELLVRCGGTSRADSDNVKSDDPLKLSLDSVLPFCNENSGTKDIKQHLTAFTQCTRETDSYEYFAQAANTALLLLSSLDVPGMPSFDDNDSNAILFHRNDPKLIRQYHQGAESKRKPDIVVISCKTARNALRSGKKASKDKIYNEIACKAPYKSFQWAHVLSTVEFKRTSRDMKPPPTTGYKVMAHDPPTLRYMNFRNEIALQQQEESQEDRLAQPQRSTRVPAATATLNKPQRQSKRLKRKRSDNLVSSEPGTSGKRSRNKDEKGKEMEMEPEPEMEKETEPEPEMEMEPEMEPGKGKGKEKETETEPEMEPGKGKEKEKETETEPEIEPGKEKEKEQVKGKEKEPIKLPAIVQNGLYAAEMFAAHVARQHVISCIVNDDIIYVWYFDRQNAIQCAGFNFVQDLPRFLVLLLIMQRMQSPQWGFNTLFGSEPGTTPTVTIQDKDNRNVDLKFSLKSKDCTTHFGLRGRATNVIPVTSTVLSSSLQDRRGHNLSDELVAKLYWPEESRLSEHQILDDIYKIVAHSGGELGDVDGHVPEVLWSHKFEGTSTSNIRSALGIDGADLGSRVFYLIVFRKLRPITELSGKEFLRAWWHVVLCHRALWKNGVYHRDVSPSNLMYYKIGDLVFGVLADYDLSSTQSTPGPSGNERTGSIPFMAIELLTKVGLEGKVKHLYRHDAESFIWVLVWVCLRYENGKLKRRSLLDDWLKKDAMGCEQLKSSFIVTWSEQPEIKPSPSHQENWEIAERCLFDLSEFYGAHQKRLITGEPEDDGESVFRKWLEAHATIS